MNGGRRGFVGILILVVIALVAIGGGALFVVNQQNVPQQVLQNDSKVSETQQVQIQWQAVRNSDTHTVQESQSQDLNAATSSTHKIINTGTTKSTAQGSFTISLGRTTSGPGSQGYPGPGAFTYVMVSDFDPSDRVYFGNTPSSHQSAPIDECAQRPNSSVPCRRYYVAYVPVLDVGTYPVTLVRNSGRSNSVNFTVVPENSTSTKIPPGSEVQSTTGIPPDGGVQSTSQSCLAEGSIKDGLWWGGGSSCNANPNPSPASCANPLTAVQYLCYNGSWVTVWPGHPTP
jgi:hypothetical protein